MSDHPTTPADVAIAISTLNSHARSVIGWPSDVRGVIYDYKAFAAMLNAHAGRIEARPIGLMAKCRYCDGSGRFISWDYGQTDEACRKCSRTGKVYLRFLETTVEGERWHHPWHQKGHEIYWLAQGRPKIEYDEGSRSLILRRENGARAEIPFGSPGDWKPNIPGERLEVERLAELLNQVEDWLLGIGYIDSDIRWRLATAQRAVTSYSLDLGRIGSTCHVCGSTQVCSAFGHLVRPFHWSRPVCEEHSRLTPDKWDKTRPELDGAIARWAERRATTKVPA